MYRNDAFDNGGREKLRIESEPYETSDGTIVYKVDGETSRFVYGPERDYEDYYPYEGEIIRKVLHIDPEPYNTSDGTIVYKVIDDTSDEPQFVYKSGDGYKLYRHEGIIPI